MMPALAILLAGLSPSELRCAYPAIDLKGTWHCALDPDDAGVYGSWGSGNGPFQHGIHLPGTTDLAGLGTRTTTAQVHEYHLTREYHHTGPAWFTRSFVIPDHWKEGECELSLERVMWQSRVWVDGTEMSPPQDSLSTPHLHALGKLAPGPHTLVIRVDNRMIHPIGDKGHAYGDQTQSKWNGVVGHIEVRMKQQSRLDRIRVFPSLDGRVKVEVSGMVAQQGMSIHCTLHGTEFGTTPAAIRSTRDGGFNQTLEFQAGKNIRPWSEFDPHLYQIDVLLTDKFGNPCDVGRVTFGFREVKRDGNRLLLNGRPAFMRGNLECAVFPKTGHPPAEVGYWKHVWNVYRSFGLNHARFHSWCPPEAAFIAADEVGIYLQVEAPFWMDRWMEAPNKRPEMDTEGHPKGLGKNDRSNDGFARAEIRRILDAYGNHPSFVFFCIGNELGTSDFSVIGQWMGDARLHDPRHLYAASTARTITTFCDYNATHSVPGIGPMRQHLEFGTAWDYEKNYSRTSVPILAHEIGQWPVYPDWSRELAAYTGPLKPLRLVALAAQAEATLDRQDLQRMHAASGAVNRLLYRDEIESFLRTPSCRGFQLLSMQDFTGQGEAMVGWLDPFYQSKGTTDPEEFRHYCAPTVPLLKLPSYVFTPGEKPEIKALLHHYGPDDLLNTTPSWTVADEKGNVIDSGKLARANILTGGLTELGSFSPDFAKCPAPARLDLSIRMDHPQLSNRYPIWIYQEKQKPNPAPAVFRSEQWDERTKAALNDGMSVLLIADRMGGARGAKLAHWLPLYWSIPFFPGQGRETLGLAVLGEHKAFHSFPTLGFGDWNWFRICQGGRGFDLTDHTPKDYQPIVRPVSDFHLNRRIGSLFELKAGRGRLLVCGYNLREERTNALPEAAQLLRSLLDYAASADFNPQTPLEMKTLDLLFADSTAASSGLPDRFSGADLYVNAAGKVTAPASGWNQGRDMIRRQAAGVDYQVEADGSSKDDHGQAWFGKSMRIMIRPRAGVPGTFYVRFHDWNHLGRRGELVFEGHRRTLSAHENGLWIEFPVIREDTNDGSLVLQTEVLDGPNLMITDIAFVPSG